MFLVVVVLVVVLVFVVLIATLFLFLTEFIAALTIKMPRISTSTPAAILTKNTLRRRDLVPSS